MPTVQKSRTQSPSIMETSIDNREKERDRRGRGMRGSRFSDADTPMGGNTVGGGGDMMDGMGGGGVGPNIRDRSRERRNCRVYISNIPYDYRWQDLKDLFRRVVGSVEYVELFYDESGKARGCGIVEFKDPDNVEKALEKMNRYEINGRELVVKEDHGEQRDQYGRIVRDGGGGGGGVGGGGGMRGNMGGGGGGGSGVGNIPGDRNDRGFPRRDDDRISGRNNFNMMGNNDYNNQTSSNYNYYGLSASFLESLGITGPLHNKVFVANLDYKVDSKKLKQVFKLAGKVQSVDLSLDKDGNSRGFAVIEYDHPVEAVQAISMLDRQMLYDRRMTVRLDRIPDKSEGMKLPEGLGGVGIGLGPNGEPLRDVARSLPNILQQQQHQHQHQHIQQQQPQQPPVPPSMGNQMVGSNLPMPGNMGGNMMGSGGVVGGGGGVGGGIVGGGAGGGNMGVNPALGGMFGNSGAGVQPPSVGAVVPPNKSQNMNSNASMNLGNLSTSNLAALSNVVGGLGAALNNPLLTTSLNNLGLNLGQNQNTMTGGGGGNDDAMSSSNAGLSNNYSTGGNNYSSGFNSNQQGGNSGGGGYNSYNSGGGVGGGSGVGGGNGGGGNNANNSAMVVDTKDFNTGGSSALDIFGVNNSVSNNASNAHKSDTIIIKNIPLSCTWQTLRDKFRDVGEVKFAEIRGNDVGVVRFFKERDAELAIALMDGSRMDGRTIKVTYF